MEIIVRQKNYQINQRSLALTGRLAIEDYTAVEGAHNDMNGSPHKMIIERITQDSNISPKEHKKT
jgi:hypothetical protein